jgi:hypothetical protein
VGGSPSVCAAPQLTRAASPAATPRTIQPARQWLPMAGMAAPLTTMPSPEPAKYSGMAAADGDRAAITPPAMKTTAPVRPATVLMTSSVEKSSVIAVAASAAAVRTMPQRKAPAVPSLRTTAEVSSAPSR